MNRESLYKEIIRKQSFLCIGLDTDIDKIPPHLLNEPDPIFSFNKAIIDATSDITIAYKPNVAFYEAGGPKGLESLKKTIDYVPEDILVIADAKRGDIGNTSTMYARSFFEHYNAGAITVAPYMGKDSIEPFLEYENKWVVILALTSNKGSSDFQKLKLENGNELYEEVIIRSLKYKNSERLMFVVGATQGRHFQNIRQLAPDHFLLVPGIGAQGGSLKMVCENGMNSRVGLIVNSSRSIIYASDGQDFADAARKAALELRNEMKTYLT